MKLIFEITPIGLAVVKSPELNFHTANPAYREYLPDMVCFSNFIHCRES
jgi:hypothetical protein